jgi:hypothetical protein
MGPNVGRCAATARARQFLLYRALIMPAEPTQQQSKEQQNQTRELSLARTRPPTEVPGYEIERFLGSGAYGEVWVGFDRKTGRPIFPIEERPVPQTDVPGEVSWPTQPFPTKPAPFDRQGVTTDDLIDFTPQLKAEAIGILGH